MSEFCFGKCPVPYGCSVSPSSDVHGSGTRKKYSEAKPKIWQIPLFLPSALSFLPPIPSFLFPWVLRGDYEKMPVGRGALAFPNNGKANEGGESGPRASHVLPGGASLIRNAPRFLNSRRAWTCSPSRPGFLCGRRTSTRNSGFRHGSGGGAAYRARDFPTRKAVAGWEWWHS